MCDLFYCSTGLFILPNMDDAENPVGQALARHGIAVKRIGDLVASLNFPNNAVHQRYDEKTLHGASAGLSWYFLDHWLREVDPIRLAIWLRIRAMARYQTVSRPSLGDLAASLSNVEPSAVRRHLTSWWFHEQPDSLEWCFFRFALRLEGRPGHPYEIRDVVLDEILHPGDDLFAPAPDPSRFVRGRVDSRQNVRGRRSDPSRNERGSVPEPSHARAHGLACLSINTAKAGQPAGAHAHEILPADLATVRQQLLQAGIAPGEAGGLLNLPDGAYWASQWCLWLPHRQQRGDIQHPARFLACMIRRAVAGRQEARTPPREYEPIRAPAVPEPRYFRAPESYRRREGKP